jgi:DNA primase
MEIREIKERLSIETVLQHYNLKADKNHRLCCPFHPDKTPSLQIYPKTNTWCCFSSNCAAGTGDQIQFMELMEKCTKHEALRKAAALAGDAGTGNTATDWQGSSNLPGRSAVELSAETGLDRIAVLTKVFSFYKNSLPGSARAVEYLKTRSLNYKLHEIAFNSATLHGRSERRHLTDSMVKYGLLKPLPTKGYTIWAKDCILLPLKNEDNKIVSLYGRSIANDDDNRHFYLSGREGLYPGYPKLTTTKLILTESIIDAATLLEQNEIAAQYEILSLYGTNGLTEEHLKAILLLPQLEEIILMLNADAAGEAATTKHGKTLKALLPEVRISKTELPDGEDVNSILTGHDDPKVLSDLIEERKPAFAEAAMGNEFLFYSRNNDFNGVHETLRLSSTEKENKQSSEMPVSSSLPPSKLNTTNPELLIYDSPELYFEILGGIRITGLDRMKVTLKVQHKEKINQPQWYSIDLYNQGQREQTVNNVAETYDLSAQTTTQTFIELITELESYRIKKIESLQPKPETKPELSASERQQAITELKKQNLLQRTNHLIGLTGITGEEQNRLIAYLVYTVRKQAVPLHVMFLGSSGSGKTWLQERLSDLIPQEDKIEITQITENALYYFKQHELKNKLLLIEDLDGAAGVFYPLRELQTKRRISKTVTLKDSKGNLKTITLTVEGPVCVSGCTTKEKIYDDNANRCILLYTDQTKDQDKRINDYQTRVAGGEINRERERQYKELFKNMQRILRPINIVNPYAKYIQLPEQVFKPRRTMTLLLGFIEAVTFYHQYQREVKKDHTGQLYIETTISDIQSAFTLLKDVLFSKSDELTKATRSFFEILKQHLTEGSQVSFTPQQIRKAFRIEPRTLQRYVRELKQYGLIKPVSGFKHRRGFEYAVADETEYSRLKSEIDGHLGAIIEKLTKTTASTTTATALRQ